MRPTAERTSRLLRAADPVPRPEDIRVIDDEVTERLRGIPQNADSLETGYFFTLWSGGSTPRQRHSPKTVAALAGVLVAAAAVAIISYVGHDSPTRNLHRLVQAGTSTRSTHANANEAVPPPTSVAITISNADGSAIHRTLERGAAQQLADIVNSLPRIAPKGLIHCGSDSPSLFDELEFQTADGVVDVHATVDGCQTVLIGSPPRYELSDYDALLDQKLHSLVR